MTIGSNSIASGGSSVRATLDLNQPGWPPMPSHKIAKTIN
jgi:hypothetical protein